MNRLLNVVPIVLAMFCVPTSVLFAREWTDATGKFKVEAELVKVEEDIVVLKREDNGKVIRVPLARLSKADSAYLASLSKESEGLGDRPAPRPGGIVAGEPQLKSARLVKTVTDGRSNVDAQITPPKGSVFLMAYFQVTKADSLPVDLELYHAQAIATSGKEFPAVGILPVNIEAPTITIAFQTVGSASGIGERTEFASSGNDDFDFTLSNSGPETKRSAKLTVKTLPGGFVLFFVVPQTSTSFQIKGVASDTLTTGKLASP